LQTPTQNLPPRSLIKYLIQYKDQKISQSAIISKEDAKFDYDGFIRKARSAVFSKKGIMPTEMDGQVSIIGPDMTAPLFQLDLLEAADWENAESIIAELWTIQNVRQITADIVINFS
jgi:hypothetical protein